MARQAFGGALMIVQPFQIISRESEWRRCQSCRLIFFAAGLEDEPGRRRRRYARKGDGHTRGIAEGIVRSAPELPLFEMQTDAVLTGY